MDDGSRPPSSAKLKHYGSKHCLRAYSRDNFYYMSFIPFGSYFHQDANDERGYKVKEKST